MADELTARQKYMVEWNSRPENIQKRKEATQRARKERQEWLKTNPELYQRWLNGEDMRKIKKTLKES